MAAFPERPEGVQEWTVPINYLDKMSLRERMDHMRRHATEIASLFRRFPDAATGCADKYGQDFVDELFSLASQSICHINQIAQRGADWGAHD